MEPDKYRNVRSSQDIADWRDASFHMVLYEYFMKNLSIPSDLGTLVVYLLFLLIMWYVVLFALRFLLSLVWPVVMVVVAVLLIRFLATFQDSDIIDMFFQTVILIADMIVAAMSKTLEYCLSFLN